MFAENLSEAISLQRRPLQTHQTLPSRPRSAADTGAVAGRRDRQHDVNRRRGNVSVGSDLFEQRRQQNGDVTSTKNDAGNFRRDHPRQLSCFNIICIDFHNNNIRKRKRDLYRRRPEVTLCSTSSSTSGAASRTFSLWFLKRIFIRILGFIWPRVPRSISGRKLFGSSDQRRRRRNPRTVSSAPASSPSTTSSANKHLNFETSRGSNARQQNSPDVDDDVNDNFRVCSSILNRPRPASFNNIRSDMEQ